VAVETSGIPDFKKEFSRNLFSNSLFFVINIFIGLLIVPFYIDKLGLAAYGIIPLATSFSSYMMLVLDSLNGAISRFLTIRIQRSDLPGASRIFNTSLFTIIGLVAVSAPVVVIVAWFIPDLFMVSGIERTSVFVLFVLIFASSLINGLQSPFSAVFYSLNKIYYSNYIGVFRTLTSTAIIVTLLLVANPSVYYVGLAYFLAAVFSLFLTITLSRQVYDKIHISVTHFSKEQFYEIITLTKWILVDQIGTLLLLQLSLIMVNIKFGTAEGGEYAIVLLLFNLVWGITGLVLTVLNPMYYTYYARGLYESMQNLSVVSVKFVGLVMALPIALICVFSPQLLTIWVGGRFAHLSTLVWIFLFPLTMIVAFRPLILNCAALNKVRVPAVYTIIAGILNLILAVILTSVFDLGVYGITLAFIFALSIRGIVFIPWYAAKIQEVPALMFYRPIVPSVLAFLVLVTIGLSVVSVFAIPASILYIGLISGAISLVYLIIVNRIILTRTDRELIRSILPPYVSHILPAWVL
jgi:O-antigen/teichoic acid export membrane protein